MTAKSAIIKATNRLKKAGFSYTRSHGYKFSSAFAGKDGYWVYLSADDHKDKMLVRTAKGPDDYHGGSNNYARITSNFEEVIELAEFLIERQKKMKTETV